MKIVSLKRFIFFGSSPISFIGPLLLVLNSFASPDFKKIMSDRNNEVLYGRVFKMLEFRLSSTSKCTVEEKKFFNHSFSQLTHLINDDSSLENLLTLYYKSYQTEGTCKLQLDNNEMKFHAIEKNKFKTYYMVVDRLCSQNNKVNNLYEVDLCQKKISRILTELNPHCSSIQVASDPKYLDNFECTVGDLLIGRLLYHAYSSPEKFIQESKKFFKNYWEFSFKLENLNSTFDLYSLFKENRTDSLSLRLNFLASLTMFHTSSPSMSPYVKGFQDYFWRRSLLENGNVKRSINLFNESRMLIDEFRQLKSTLGNKSQRYTIEGRQIHSMNRHNYMAMFLSCYYAQDSKIVKTFLPLFLGNAYESIDFISHLMIDGDSWDEAKNNFITDTNRYKEGVQMANSFCRLLPMN